MAADATLKLTAPPEVYRRRRATLADALTCPLVIFSGHAPARNYPANTFPFRAGSSYLYFGGPPLENAALCIEPGSDGDAGCTLLRPTWGVDEAVWVGDPLPDEVLAGAAGLSVNRLAAPDQLEGMVADRAARGVVPPFPETMAWARRLNLTPADADDLRAIIDLRLHKDEHELAAMRYAARVAVDAHKAAMAACQPGRREADVAAAFSAVLIANQCDHSFTPIITIRGEMFHGHGHPNVMPEGALLLVDAGAAEQGGYASDVTRTFPVNGKWKPIQRLLYDTVERANREATAGCVVGARFRDLHFLAGRIIIEGLIEAGILRGKPDTLLERNAHTLFFPHGLGHLIGLDVHDMEDFGDLAGYAPGRQRPTEFGNKFLRMDRDLAPGMCMTIEPGLYFVPAIWSCPELVAPLADVVNREKVDELLAAKFGGIRIEHTVCVRESGGPEVLSAGVPTAADEITVLVGQG